MRHRNGLADWRGQIDDDGMQGPVGGAEHWNALEDFWNRGLDFKVVIRGMGVPVVNCMVEESIR